MNINVFFKHTLSDLVASGVCIDFMLAGSWKHGKKLRDFKNTSKYLVLLSQSFVKGFLKKQGSLWCNKRPLVCVMHD